MISPSENNYYMIITTPSDYKLDIKNEFNFVGFPERNRNSVMKFQNGDKIIVYVTQKSSFAAVLEVTGEPYCSYTQVWDDEYILYPYRVSTTPIFYAKSTSEMVFIKDIWDDLSFITNKHKWGSQVQGSFRKITEADFNLIKTNILTRNGGLNQ